MALERKDINGLKKEGRELCNEMEVGRGANGRGRREGEFPGKAS